MVEYISPKKSWFCLAASFCMAAGAAAALNCLLGGPRLGPWYDFLMGCRPPPPVSGEVLLIETGKADVPGSSPEENSVEPGVLAQALLTLMEMDAAALVVQTPVLSLSSGEGRGEDITLRFDEEFSLLGRNIRNLFEAIRVGSIPPAESGRYVGELVDLSEAGKERLLAALIHREGEGMIRLGGAAAAFGRVWEAEDLPLSAGFSGQGGYSRVPPDGDGRLRRIAPVRYAGEAGDGDPETGGTGHVVYGLFKDRYPREEMPLDRGGALLIEAPREGAPFRRVNFDALREYDREDRTLRRLLGEAEARGIYNTLEPENYPPLLYDYARAFQEDLLEEPGKEKRILWIAARRAYFRGLEAFLSGPAEDTLVTGYREIIASGELDEEGIARLRGLETELIAAFAGIRESGGRLLDIRRTLEKELSAAICILGPAGAGPAGEELSDAEASAVLANAFLTDRFIVPGEKDYLVILLSLGCALISLLCIRRQGPLLSLFLGLLLAALTGAGFSSAFVIRGRWLDPLIPSGASAAGVLSSTLAALVIRSRFARRFRAAYGPAAGGNHLGRLLRDAKPRPEEVLVRRAAIVAVRNSALLSREDREQPPAAVAAARAFHEDAARLFWEAGAVMVGCWGDLALAAFGSPLEEEQGWIEGEVEAAGKGSEERAADFVSRLPSETAHPDRIFWRFGIDAGDCSFTWSPLSGYGAYGRPAARAQILAGLAARYKARVLISESVGKALPQGRLRKLDTLGSQDGGGKEPFYELIPERPLSLVS